MIKRFWLAAAFSVLSFNALPQETEEAQEEQMQAILQNTTRLQRELAAAATPAAIPTEDLEAQTQNILANTALLEETITAGKRASIFCMNCHGESGMSVSDEVPNLSGQNAAYLFEQSRKFATGERKDAFMEGLIKVLTNEEILQIAVFYSQSKVQYKPADPAKEQARTRGKKRYNLLCQRCHGAHGMGDGLDNDLFGAKIARISGQPVTYLVKTLKRYRDKTGERLNTLMLASTQTLSDRDVDDLAEYINQLR